MNEVSMGVGLYYVETTQNGGHPPEFYAETVTDKIIGISYNASPEIRLQAEAFREKMKSLILAGIKQAILSNHTTVIYQLQKAGMNEAAVLIHELRNAKGK